jgi:hypothetical protein
VVSDPITPDQAHALPTKVHMDPTIDTLVSFRSQAGASRSLDESEDAVHSIVTGQIPAVAFDQHAARTSGTEPQIERSPTIQGNPSHIPAVLTDQTVAFDRYGETSEGKSPTVIADTLGYVLDSEAGEQPVLSFDSAGGNAEDLVQVVRGQGGNNMSFVLEDQDPKIFAILETHDAVSESDQAATLITAGGTPGRGYAAVRIEEPTAILETQWGEVYEQDVATLQTGGGKPGQGYPAVRTPAEMPEPVTTGALTASYSEGIGGFAGQDELELAAAAVTSIVRRLTPLECERLQGFPDNWTDIPGNPSSQRYKQMGNAVAVPVVEYLMKRIAEADEADRS